MNPPRPPRPGGTPAPRRPQGPPPPTRRHVVTPAPSKKGLYIGIGAGAVALILAIAVLAPGNKTVEPEPVVTQPPPKVVPKPVPPPPKPPPAPVPAPVAAPPPAPPKKQDPVEARKAELAQLAKAKREEGAVLVVEARKNVDQDLEREKKEAEEFARRFSGYRFDAKLVTGAAYSQALVTGFNADELTLKTTERDAVTVPWNMIAPDSVLAVANHVYRAQTADDQVALARFLVERRLWKEAQAALQKAMKLDDEHERMAERYDEAAAPLLTGKGIFQGALKMVGASGLRLAYDFSDPAQGDDFEGMSEGFTLEGGKLVLEAGKTPRVWRVGDRELEFGDELELEAKVSVEGALLVIFYRRPESDFYFVEVGPAGTFLKKGKSVTGAQELAKNDKAVLKGEQKLRVTVKRRKVSVAIADRPALSFDDPAVDGDTRGQFQLGVNGTKAVFTPTLVVSGQVNPDYLRKKVGTIEMEARRAVSKDLGEVRELEAKQMTNLILGGSAEGISADMLAIEFLTIQDLPTYDKMKQELSRPYYNPEERKTLVAELDALLAKHAGFPSLWYLRGILHLRQYELGEARDKFAKAVALFPDFYEAHYQVGVTWQYAREFEKALEGAKKSLEIRPDYANGHMLQAEMRFAIDKKAALESERELRVAEKLNGNGAEVLRLRRWVKMQARGPRDLGCIYEFESANYRIVTDISQERASWYADQLEVVRGTYMDIFKKWYRGDTRPKPRIAIFNTREAFYTYSELCSTNRHENALGFFDPANNELVLFEDLDLNETLETLYHEAFHHFASAMLKFPPYWWNEGIAEYMSAVRIDPAKKAVKERARTLRGRLGNIQMALRGGFFVDFDKIINYNPSEFYGPLIGVHYAQAWAMIHFFYEYQGGKHRPLIEQYFDELVGGKTQLQAFDAVFKGKTDELEKEWKEFTKGLKPPATP